MSIFHGRKLHSNKGGMNVELPILLTNHDEALVLKTFSPPSLTSYTPHIIICPLLYGFGIFQSRVECSCFISFDNFVSVTVMISNALVWLYFVENEIAL